ncbi:hypothetical protein ACA910_010926 [Epithemia clementina (nom. ined.)]
MTFCGSALVVPLLLISAQCLGGVNGAVVTTSSKTTPRIASDHHRRDDLLLSSPTSSMIRGHHNRQLQELPGTREHALDLIDSTNATLSALTEENMELKEQKSQLGSKIMEQNTSLTEIMAFTAELQQYIDELSELNSELLLLEQGLQAESSHLEQEAQELENATQAMENLATTLSNEFDFLSQTNSDLTELANSLNETISNLELDKDALQALLNDLAVITTYLAAVGTNVTTQTYTDVETALLQDIADHRVEAFTVLYNFYSNAVSKWDCRNDDLFADQVFYRLGGRSYRDISIARQSGSLQALLDVLNVVTVRMLDPLCLDPTNFAGFLTYSYYPDSSYASALREVTYNQLQDAVEQFGTNALLYYGLPIDSNSNNDVTTISPDQWEAAKFDCHNLEAPYIWVDPRS